MPDLLASVFDVLEVKTVVYFLHDFVSPWGLHIPRRPHSQFHFLVSGDAFIEVDGQTFKASPGDLLLLPHGAEHTVSDGSGSLREGTDAVPRIVRGERPFGEGPASARLLSGHFEFAREAMHFFGADLPDVLRTNVDERDGRTATASLMQVLAGELVVRRPGAEVILKRLAEIALVQTLRGYFAEKHRPPVALSAVFDPQLQPAMVAMHTHYGETLRLRQLADAAHMSRSAFALHFKQATTLTPMEYLTRWRMLQARKLLHTTTMTVGEVAAAVGQQSQEGFSRAFKRFFGRSPRAEREVQASAAGGS